MVHIPTMVNKKDSFPWENLLDVLRNELQEYGGLVGLLAEQQNKILKRDPDDLLEVNRSVQEQMEASQQILTDRQKLVARLASERGQDKEATLSEMLEYFPRETKPMFESLIEEINHLITVARRRVLQNQNLLKRMADITEQLILTANPQAKTTTYNRSGEVSKKIDANASVESNA